MSRFFLILICFISLLRAEYPSQDLIKIHAKIYPQLLFFNESTNAKTEAIIIVATYTNTSSRVIADSFKKNVEEYYGNGIKGRQIIIMSVFCGDVAKLTPQPTGIYIVDCEPPAAKYFTQYITFSASRNFFDDNTALFYIEITQKTNILLNKKLAKNPNFAFSPALLKLVTIAGGD
ncbi:MAG: hypothetical protein RL154_1043 [Pseudomonadota bacterium]|jgi:hypothetical protein